MAVGATYLERYVAGEYEQVWAELVALGEQVREEPLYADAWAVACETMRRVRANIERLIPRLVQVGFSFGYDHLIQDTLQENRPMRGSDWVAYLDVLGWSRTQPPVLLPAQLAREYRDYTVSLGFDASYGPEMFDPGVVAPDMQAHIEELDRLVGPLPLSLRAWYTEVGAVNFYGYHPDWARFTRLPEDLPIPRERYLMSECDPLQVCVLDDARVGALRDLHARGLFHQFEFAPDRYFKDYTAGSSTPFAFSAPNPSMDATLGVYEPRPTFVEYLRRCLRWAGFPGMAEWPSTPDADLSFVTEDLVPF
jgi:hypothetical protein